MRWLLILALLSGCASLPKPSGPHGPSERDARLLDPDAGARLLIEVDRVDGARPRARSLAVLMKKAAHYLDKPGGIELVVDDVIPAEQFEPKASKIRFLAARHRSLGNPEDTVVVHVLYGTSWAKWRGYAWPRDVMKRYGGSYKAPLVTVYQDRLKSILWITGAKQESNVLVHELGHTLGLATDPGHSMKGHCTNAWCLLYNGVDVRTLSLYFLPTLFTGYLPLDFCQDCRDDLYEDGVPPGERR